MGFGAFTRLGAVHLHPRTMLLPERMCKDFGNTCDRYLKYIKELEAKFTPED
jgi:hypothetical protein